MNERSTGAGILQLAPRLLQYSLRRWSALVLVLAVTLAQTGAGVLKPWPLKVLVDNVLGDQPLPGVLARAAGVLPRGTEHEIQLVWIVAATVLVFLLEWALGLAARYASIAFGQRLMYDLAADLFDHLQRLSLAFNLPRLGDSIRRVTRDSTCVSVIVEDVGLPVLSSVLSLALMFTIMWGLDPLLTVLTVSVTPLLILAFRRYAGPMEQGSYAHEQAEADMYDVLEQTLSAMPAVQAFGREEDADRRFRAATQSSMVAELALTKVQVKFQLLVGLSTALGTAAILWVGAEHVLNGQLTVGTVVVFLSSLASLYRPLESVMELSSRLQGVAGSATRMMEVLDADSEVADRPGAQTLRAARGAIRLERVSFGYTPGHPVLREVLLDVAPGQTVALVGPTGAGKSTLVSLVPRFFDPWSGRVLVDGRDVREVSLRSLRGQVAVVLQEPFLFPLSIAENIAYGRPSASRGEIEAAARTANAHAFIERLVDGYDTLVGERGATLSGGERQRVSIARALLKDAPMLILDEPTSALDAETEAVLLEALHRLMLHRTTLIIAHRLSTIRRADVIVVLDNGVIVERGSHAELLARDGRYARFHQLQHAEPALV